jgi:hypothetical protein
MSNPSWHASGQYFEACNCDYVCPCVPSNLAEAPTKGFCDVPLVFHIEHGQFGDVSLDGLNFVVVAHTPGIMGQGDWTVGLIVDERANPQQVEAITGIASGHAGGPMAGLAPLIGTFKGVEQHPIQFEMNGLSRSVSVPGLIEMRVEGVPSAVAQDQPLQIDNTMHPANSRLALAKAAEAHAHAFGIEWDETSGRTNGHFAPFTWSA